MIQSQRRDATLGALPNGDLDRLSPAPDSLTLEGKNTIFASGDTGIGEFISASAVSLRVQHSASAVIFRFRISDSDHDCTRQCERASD